MKCTRLAIAAVACTFVAAAFVCTARSGDLWTTTLRDNFQRRAASRDPKQPAGTGATESPTEPKLNAVLWVGGYAHDFDSIATVLADALPKRLPMNLKVVRDGSFLDAPEAAQLDVILMNHCYKATQGVLTDAQKQKLLERVRSGVGVVGIHASYYSFEEWEDYHRLYGARFVKHEASDARLVVTIVDKEHPITQGLDDSFEVVSELYQSTPPAEDCRILARSREAGTDPEYPSVWTRTYGKGRIVAILPGHWPDSYRVDGFQKLLASAARWAARRSNAAEGRALP